MKRITIDLHGYTVSGARALLTRELKKCPHGVEEIEVIHGCNSGQTLQSLVRSFSHPKIERRIVGLNNGMTIFVLKRGL